MIDPWAEFTQATEGHDVAGYFEAAPRDGRGAGRALWFAGADEVRTISRSSKLEEEARRTDRFVAGGRGRAVLGYLGFDAVGLFEPRLARFPVGAPFPLGEFAFVRRPHRGTVPRRSHPTRSGRPARLPRPVGDSMTLGQYGRGVGRLVEAIRSGEAYQVVLAHRRAWPRPSDLLARAGRLRASERYAFFYYLRFDDREIVGATPESVVEIVGRNAFVNPIAGTIPRGRGRAGRAPLTVDPKELSEHRMLVDLARNDLGAIATAGSVRLLSKERLERYARLDHLVTRVTARLRPGVGAWRALGAAFPAGTVVGAPKIRATELLRAEERTWRGPYAGSVGLLEAGGRATWALAIRTAFASGNRLYTAAGAGIVHRSEPRREFEETLTKLGQVEATLVGGAR